MLKEVGVGLALVVVVLAGSVLRAIPVLADDFPVNDGGMFLVMVDEIRTNGFALPSLTGYNDASIPFAYPPLALYAAAVVTAAGPATTDVLRFVPLLFSIASIPLMYLIGRRVLGRSDLAVVSAGLFSFTTGSYQWLVMGGGLTRSLGLLMALVAVYLAIRLYRELRPWAAVACGMALGATALSHPQAAVFGALSVPLLLPFTATDRGRALRLLLLVIAVAGVVVLPWLTVVVLEHGVAPIIAAAGTGGGSLLGVLSLISSQTSRGYLEVIGIATSLGIAICCFRRFWVPPVWILAIAIADSRAGQPYLAVPAALAIAFLLADIETMARRALATRKTAGWARHWPTALAVLVILAAFFDSLASQLAPGSPLRSLTPDSRSAMAWVRAETAPEARVVVVSGRYWAADAEAEWFPALAERRSVATVQGAEWLGRFTQQVNRAGELFICVVNDDRQCLADWFSAAEQVDYLFLVNTSARELGGLVCCHQLADQVSSIYETQVVHREGAVLVIRLTPRSS